MATSNVHDRHEVPSADEEFDSSADNGQSQEESKPTEKAKFSWPGKDAKEQQKIRDAHFLENGVKADGTGGKAPEEEAA